MSKIEEKKLLAPLQDFVLHLSAEHPVDKVRQLILSTLDETEVVLKNPKPFVHFRCGESTMDYYPVFFLKNYEKVPLELDEVHRNIWDKLYEANIRHIK